MSGPQIDSRPGRFRPFFNPNTGEHIEYTAVAEDNDGQLIRFNWRSAPGGAITEHIHPHQEERFTILAGKPRFTLNGQEHLARAGQTVVIPAGVPHSAGNVGSVDIDGVVELQPALHTKQWHGALAGLVADGNTDARGAPKNPLQLGHILALPPRKPSDVPPIWMQNLMLPPLWALAKGFSCICVGCEGDNDPCPSVGDGRLDSAADHTAWASRFQVQAKTSRRGTASTTR